MTQQNRYPVLFREAPAGTLAAAGISTAGAPVRVSIDFRAEMTPDEFREAFGPDRNIVHQMAVQIEDLNGWTVNVYPSDVLACEGDHTMQTAMINAVLEQQGQPPLDEHQTHWDTKGWDDISPEAMLFLLNLHDHFPGPSELDNERAISLMKDAGLCLQDFLKDTPEEKATASATRTAKHSA